MNGWELASLFVVMILFLAGLIYQWFVDIKPDLDKDGE